MPSAYKQTKEPAQQLQDVIQSVQKQQQSKLDPSAAKAPRKSERINNQQVAERNSQEHYNNLAKLIGHRAVIICGAGVSAQLAPDHTDVLIWNSFVKLLRRRVQLYLNKNDEYYERWVEVQDAGDKSLPDLTECG